MKPFRFSYKTLQDLIDDCHRRNLSINFRKETDVLYEPFEIAGRQVGNRLAIHPMEGSDATTDGKPGELTFRRWKRFAAGGAKLIWGEAAAVVAEGRSNPRQLLLVKENTEQFAALVRHARQTHREKFGTDDDLVLGIQLAHAGRHCFEKPLIIFHSRLRDSFTFLDKRSGSRLPADYPVATDALLEELEDRFVDAARVARDAGFDFVDIKQCHTYLLNELLAAHRRSGRYGGSFENRTRFARNVIQKIRDALASDILLASRLNAFDGVPYVKDPETGEGVPIEMTGPREPAWGTDADNPAKEDLSEPKQLVAMLYELGVSLFSISAGSPYWSPHIVRPFSKPVDGGYQSPEHPLAGIDRLFRLTGEMQKLLPAVPFAGSGYSWLREFLLNAGAANVAEGNVSIVGVGRTAFAYPDFAADGQGLHGLNSRKICLADSMCSNMLRAWDKNKQDKIPAGCPVRDSKYQEIYRNEVKSSDGSNPIPRQANGDFKRCSCGARWSTRSAFVSDPDIEPIGISFPSDGSSFRAFYFFNHSCKTTLVIDSEDFADLITAPVPSTIRKGEKVCKGHCSKLKDLQLCSADCRNAPFRRFFIERILTKKI